MTQTVQEKVAVVTDIASDCIRDMINCFEPGVGVQVSIIVTHPDRADTVFALSTMDDMQGLIPKILAMQGRSHKI